MPYDTALICLNGHVVNSGLKTWPEKADAFCSECGEKTISQCPKCQTAIRGRFVTDVGPLRYDVPSYCRSCGAPYPWTERKLEAARELIALANIEDAEKQALSNDLPNLMNDTPRTKVAATRFRLFLDRAGQELGSGLRDLLVNITHRARKGAVPRPPPPVSRVLPCAPVTGKPCRY